MWLHRLAYVELNAAQRSPTWFAARKRITASTYEKVLGLSSFGTQDEAITEILGYAPKKETNEAMYLGTVNEDPMRDMYTQYMDIVGYPIKIYEPSLCISLQTLDFPVGQRLLSQIYPSQYADPLHPNWFIGGSPDGIITDNHGYSRNLEMKYTKRMYPALTERLYGQEFSPRATPTMHPELLTPRQNQIANSFGTPNHVIDGYMHIYRSHYMQMQGCMSITHNSSCDYVVGSSIIDEEDQLHYENLIYDREYWQHFLYPSLIYIIERKIKPQMTRRERETFINGVKEIISITSPADYSVVAYV